MRQSRGLGVDAGLDVGVARELAARCEALGYHSLWSNDEPGMSGLETLAHFAAGAPGLELGVGVLPLDRHEPSGIVSEIERLGLNPSHLWLGIGTGPVRSIDVVQRSVDELRALLPDGTRIVVAAMRPRLCHLGGAIADGVLLNWMLPPQAASMREHVRQGAADAQRQPPLVASYVRVSVGEGATERLRAAESIYRRITEGYRQHFVAMDVPLGTVGIAAASRAKVVEALEQYDSVLDLTIVRVLGDRTASALSAVADAAAP